MLLSWYKSVCTGITYTDIKAGILSQFSCILIMDSSLIVSVKK